MVREKTNHAKGNNTMPLSGINRDMLNSKDTINIILEHLRKQRLISNSSGRPASWLTDDRWQNEFELQRVFIKPFPPERNITRLKGKYSKEKCGLSDKPYYGTTKWQNYCTYINDVLRNIERGHVDYCYFVYQILDLLRFHHDSLRTRYVEDGEYWEVWLNS